MLAARSEFVGCRPHRQSSAGQRCTTSCTRRYRTLQPCYVSPKQYEDPPWTFGFQCNERYLQWDDSAQRQLLKIHARQKLQCSDQQLNDKLQELARLLPDLASKLERLRADVLLALLSNLPRLARELLQLRDLMPQTNVSELVSKHPKLLIDMDAAAIAAKLQLLRQHLPGANVERLVEFEPLLLTADVVYVLGEIRRLLPQSDPVQFLLSNPRMVLDMSQSGLPSAIELDN